MKKHPIRFEAYYSEPIARVWRALTDPLSLSHWLTRGDFKAIQGHKFEWKEPEDTQDARESPMEGTLCEIQEVDAPYRLSYRVERSPGSASIVTWSLEPMGEGTNVVIEHEILITTELKAHPSVISMATHIKNRTLIKMQMELNQSFKKEMEIAA